MSSSCQVNKLYSISFYTGNNNDTDQPLILSYLAQVFYSIKLVDYEQDMIRIKG